MTIYKVGKWILLFEIKFLETTESHILKKLLDLSEVDVSWETMTINVKDDDPMMDSCKSLSKFFHIM